MYANRLLVLVTDSLNLLSLAALAIMAIATVISMVKLSRIYFWVAVTAAACFYIFQMIYIHLGGYFGI